MLAAFRRRSLLDRLVGLLAGGEQQLLALARGLLARSVLLLDKPSPGLVPAVAQELFKALHRLRDEGLTLLLVDQTTEFALPLADRRAVLSGGSIGHVAAALDYLNLEAA